MDFKLILQIAGVVLGLLYLYLEYKANIWLWVVGLAMPAIHSILYFKAGLYADFGMEVYYILAGIYGLAAWLISGGGKGEMAGDERLAGDERINGDGRFDGDERLAGDERIDGDGRFNGDERIDGDGRLAGDARIDGDGRFNSDGGEKVSEGGKMEKKVRSIGFTPKNEWTILAAVYILLHAGLYLFLSKCTDSTVPYWDAFTTSLSAIAMWMLSRKYVEQWLVWLIVDAVTVALYFYKGIPLTACLYLLYTALAIVGYRKWKRLAA